LVDGSVNVPWVNEGGATYDGRKNYYQSDFTKLTVDGKPAAKVVHDNTVNYLILRDNDYIRLTATPADSIFMGDFDKMISSFTFTPVSSSSPSATSESNMHCGGNIKNPATCPGGYHCQLDKIPDVGGVCVKN
jgi:hypothetical protein